jgi:hypothetical protein
MFRPTPHPHEARPSTNSVTNLKIGQTNIFWLCNVHLLHQSTRLQHLTCNLAELQSATFVGLPFCNQKNGVRGEIIGLGRSQHHAFCPVHAAISCITHLQCYNTPTTTPLYMVHMSPSWIGVNTMLLTPAL